jgi:flagellar biosynthesis protein FliQ
VALGRHAIILIISLSLPLLLVALIFGFTISLFQAVSSVQEQTLGFAFKSYGVTFALICLAPWMLNTLLQDLVYVLSHFAKLFPK